MAIYETDGSSRPRIGRIRHVEGITEDQYRQINEFPLSEQTRSLAAFSGRPLL